MNVDNEIQKKRNEVLKIGVESIVYALFNTDLLQNMAVESNGDERKQTILNMWSFLASQAILWILEEVMRGLPDRELERLANGERLSGDPDLAEAAYRIFNPVNMALLIGPVVAEKNPAAKYDPSVGRVVWSGWREPEYVKYLEKAAIDNMHGRWLVHLVSEISKDDSWFEEVDSELLRVYGTSFNDLFTTLKLLECWMHNPEKKAKMSPELPIYRLDPEHLQTPLRKRIGITRTEKVVSALTWQKHLELSKHPLIPDGQGSYMFAHWYCRYAPSLVQNWLYPYFYHGHQSISGIAGDLRGSIFERYLKEMIESVVGHSCVIMNKELTSGNCSALSAVHLQRAEIDLAVNLGEVGLVIDAKGGVHELPKELERIRWHAITPDDVYHRFEDNKDNSDKWDKVVRAVRSEPGILRDINLIGCNRIIPVIVHSKVQPITIEDYRKKYQCPSYETETHSLESFTNRVIGLL